MPRSSYDELAAIGSLDWHKGREHLARLAVRSVRVASVHVSVNWCLSVYITRATLPSNTLIVELMAEALDNSNACCKVHRQPTENMENHEEQRKTMESRARGTRAALARAARTGLIW